MIFSAHFAHDGEIYALMSDSTRPARMVALDDATGAERRVLLRGEDAPVGHEVAVDLVRIDERRAHPGMAGDAGRRGAVSHDPGDARRAIRRDAGSVRRRARRRGSITGSRC